MAFETPTRRRARIIVGVAVFLLLLLCLVLLRVLTLWRLSEWRTFDGMPEEILKHYVQTADDTLEEWLQKIHRKDGRSYAVTFTQSQINACCGIGLAESDKVPDVVREQFKDMYVAMKPGVLALSLKSGWLGIGTLTIAASLNVSECGDLSAQLRYAKLGVFRIPTVLALRTLNKATEGSKLEGLFEGKEIDPADIYIPFIVLQIDSLEIGEGKMTIKGHIK